jgi:hypothetical protein
MRFCNSITAQVLVWLAALFVPVQALHATACGCRSHSTRSREAKSAGADVAPAAKCSHCTGGSRPQNSCCGSATASSEQGGRACDANGSCCCCKGGPGSQGSNCQCSANNSAPAPDPLPGTSQTDDAKSLTTASCGGLTVAVFVPPTGPAYADERSTLLCFSAPERLSVLCRLVI